MPNHDGDRRVALVTGASSGVGRVATLSLAQAGFEVYAAARRVALLAELAAESPNIHAAPLDVTDRPAVDQLAATIQERHGKLDVLVCNAGVNIPRRRFAELSVENWHLLMETNATATFHVIQGCLLLLRAAKGLVIVVASVSSRWPDASGPAYQASKRAMLGLAHAVSLEEQANGIRVSSILPGMIDTPLLDRRPQPPSAEQRADSIPPEDIAAICVFLANLPARSCIPEIVVTPSVLQRIGSMR